MSKFLDSTGLSYLWSKIKTALVEKIDEPASDGSAGQVLTTDGNGGRSWATVQGGNDVGLSVVNGKVCITYEEVSA